MLQRHVRVTLALAALALAGLAGGASAQVASSMLNEGDPLPGQPGHTVFSLNNTAVNQVGGWSATVNSTDGVNTVSQAWGDPTGGGSPTVLFQEGTYGSLTQTAWETFFGMDDLGQIAYSATGTGGPVGSFDSVWVDSTPIAVEGDPSSVMGQFWRFASRPGITSDGNVYFVGGLTSTAGGSTQNYGLFFGPSATPVLLGGQSVPNLPFVLSMSSSIGFDLRYSALGTHYIIDVLMATTSASDNAMVVDGAGLMLGGSLVREGSRSPWRSAATAPSTGRASTSWATPRTATGSSAGTPTARSRPTSTSWSTARSLTARA